jgi:molybdenum cofactor cytidylyltransferase
VIAAIVLAAGSSARMGSPKPLVRIGDRPMLSHVLDGIRGSQVDRTIVVLGDSAGRVRDEVPMDGAIVVENPSFREGMSASLRAGLGALRRDTDAFFVVLGDAPFVRSGTYDTLIVARQRTGARVLLPTYHGVRGNPVLLDRSLGAEAEALTGDRGCRQIHQRHPDETVEVAVEDPGVVIDIDTPEQAELARAVVRDGRPLATLVGEISRVPRGPSGKGGPEPARVRRPGAARTLPDGAGGAAARLVLVGDTPVAEGLSALGRLLGFRVAVAGPDVDPVRFPEADEVAIDLRALSSPLDRASYVVIATMEAYGGEALAVAVRSDAAYIGLVANRRRATALLADLAKEGFSTRELERVRTPAGLDIRAETPEEIALSVAAEIVQRVRAPPSATAAEGKP